MRSVARSLSLLAFLLLPTFAQAQTTLAGVVRDPSGSVLPGVTVEVSSPALIEKTRSAVSDGSGLYRITDLPPGVYAVSYYAARLLAGQTRGAVALRLGGDHRRYRVAPGSHRRNRHGDGRVAGGRRPDDTEGDGAEQRVIQSLPVTRSYTGIMTTSRR